MLKRAGRGHAESGVVGTKHGELALMCPACPWPDVNLPLDWESAPVATKSVQPLLFTALVLPPLNRFIYRMLFCIDACFRFKRTLVSNYRVDPEMGPGWAYMVEWEPYRRYLRHFTDQVEVSCHHPPFLYMCLPLYQMSTCSGLAALDYANSKYSKGYSVTGIGAVTCRHEFVLAEGVGALQKGERCVLSPRIPARILTLRQVL